jgi:hypothetical protein
MIGELFIAAVHIAVFAAVFGYVFFVEKTERYP